MRRAIFLLTSLLGCAPALPFEPAGPEAAPDPAELGPYPVGVRTMTVTDPRRFDPETRTPRTLTVEVWYPATEAARGGEGEVYPFDAFVPEDLKASARQLGGFETLAVRDASPLEDEDFPIILFSHGSGGVRVQSVFLTVHLASHGYVVASPDHVGNTLSDLIVEGLDFQAVSESFLDRPMDLTASLRAVEAEFSVDASQIGTAGHSFGAVTALRLAGLDPRIKAAVPQAPAGHLVTWLGVDRPLDTLGIPVMIQDAGLDDTVPVDTNARTFIPHLGSPSFYVSLPTAGHFTYSDLCQLDTVVIEAAAALGVGNVLADGCSPENISAEEAQPLIRYYTIGLFNAYLRGSPGTLERLRAETRYGASVTVDAKL